MLIQSILTIGSVVHGHVVTVYGIGRWAEYITVARRDKNPVIGYDVNTNFIFSFWFFFFRHDKTSYFFYFSYFPSQRNMCHGTNFCLSLLFFCFSVAGKHVSWNKVLFLFLFFHHDKTHIKMEQSSVFLFLFHTGKKNPQFRL